MVRLGQALSLCHTKIMKWLFLLLVSGMAQAAFEGRVSRLNESASLMKIAHKADEIKFLKEKDILEFWNESYPSKKCQAKLSGRGNDYLLFEIPNYKKCVKNVYLTTGSVLKFGGEIIEERQAQAQKVTDLLLKKRLALSSLLERKKRYGSYDQKVDALNKLYRAKIEKVEADWAKELENIKSTYGLGEKRKSQLEAELEQVDFELERYRLPTKPETKDRWALDKTIYTQK